MTLFAGAVLIIGISTIYPTGYGGPSAAYAAAQTITTVEKVPIDTTTFISCVAGGAGEEVQIRGQLHIVDHLTFDGAGDVHVESHLNYQGLSGTGLTTGDKYQISGPSNFASNAKVGQETTVVFSLNAISHGAGSNFLLHVTLHTTVNADGTMTSEVVNIRSGCK